MLTENAPFEWNNSFIITGDLNFDPLNSNLITFPSTGEQYDHIIFHNQPPYDHELAIREDIMFSDHFPIKEKIYV
jgi:hypothetical protein